MLPPLEHDYSNRYKLPTKSTPAYEVRHRLMEMTLEALQKNAGFVIPKVSAGTFRYAFYMVHCTCLRVKSNL